MNDIQDIHRRIHPLKVLLVDDEEGVLEASGEFLKKFFNTVDLAVDGVQALNTIHNNGPYDVLITDLQMPNMNGYQLINEIKDDYKDMFTVIMSGNIDDEKHISEICDVYLTKPTSFQSMIDMLKNVIERKGL